MSEAREPHGLRANAPPFIPSAFRVPTLKKFPSDSSPEITTTPVVMDTYDYIALEKPTVSREYSSLSEIVKVPIFYEYIRRSCLIEVEGFEPVFTETIPPEIIINFILINNKEQRINAHISFHPHSPVGNTTHLKCTSGEIMYNFVYLPLEKILYMKPIYRSGIIDEKMESQITRIIQCINNILRIYYDTIIIDIYIPIHMETNAYLKYKTEQYNNYLSNYNNLISYIAYLESHSTLEEESKRMLIIKCQQKIEEINNDIFIKLDMHPRDFVAYLNRFQKIPRSIPWRKKYMKYKNKYLNLKNKLNK